ncbi:hypothetical protein [Emticicia sp. C21]|uniref:hypothetical protein n=1 Tax=Emticicia sp. C21 TaxID=2302915 RepID=UPI000E34A5E8|nr:hypothetical protein [Emticicia sp. C21]RFS17384.1 hypothetical protein D0T08_06285 [Emticicia sp. C21]
MRTLSLLCLLLFSPFTIKAITLKWVDEVDRCAYRIDTQKKIIEKETRLGIWEVFGNINLLNVDEKEILPSNDIICLTPSNKSIRYLLVDCTNQVYQFDFKGLNFERIDKTYYRGYNCQSIRFIRKDTLYCVGGYGCFRTNNLLTYFQNETKEWDAINSLNNPPISIHKGLNGYYKERDIFFSGLNYYYSDAENNGNFINDFGMNEYSFRDKKWTTLGKITNPALLKIVETPNRVFDWNGKYFVIRVYEAPNNKIFIIDPVKNEVFKWEDKKRLFEPISDAGKDSKKEYIIGDSLYSSKLVTTAPQNYVSKQVVSLEQLKKEATFIGKVYESSGVNYWLISSIIAAIIIVCAVFYLKRSKAKPKEFGLSDKLDDIEKAMLAILIQNHHAEGIDTEQINTLLQVNNKTIENQRKVRHDFIKALTPKLALIYGIEEPIEKIPSSIDKRIFNYKLNNELYKKVTNQVSKT